MEETWLDTLSFNLENEVPDKPRFSQYNPKNKIKHSTGLRVTYS